MNVDGILLSERNQRRRNAIRVSYMWTLQSKNNNKIKCIDIQIKVVVARNGSVDGRNG